MATNSHTYLKNRIGAEISEEDNKTTFVFQKERVGFKRTDEIIFLKEVHPNIRKEVVITDDELIIQAHIPSNYKRFSKIHLEDAKSRWMFAHQLIERVYSHPHPRLNLIVCPENIVYSRGMDPVFIYYGVLGSLPPFDKNDERVWLETKAVVAATIDDSFTFEEYLKYSEVLELKEIGAKVMTMQDSQVLLDYIGEQLELLEIKERENVNLPRKKWKVTKWLSIGLGVLLLPAIIFTIIYFIHEKPKNEAFIDSHQSFLGQNYSQVVTDLSPYSVKSMPFIVLYELAYSSVTNERLDEEQKKNVLSNITLQTDANYLKYWIYLGREEAENAVDLARSMEDGELITYGLLKRREEIKADRKLSGEEIQTLLDEVDREVEEYEKLMEQEEKESEE
ncbi:type VII secretion protein EssB [Psychrobacillus vulpis]|uniref:Type VII secretion protein EssB n=1 Tax=Psychrobacillus vulpis TaxID=2325572 RepID=A0A544TV12_9BACI|nr:type VII secretion protein EssB [Psychrobacillus vulpis]TQR21287.1 type VII secretion protein EssB [Psychrobacillus vulpis]